MAIINVSEMTIDQLNALIVAATIARDTKADNTRKAIEDEINSKASTLIDTIKNYEETYAIVMRVRDNAGRVKHFNMCGDVAIHFDVTLHNNKSGF